MCKRRSSSLSYGSTQQLHHHISISKFILNSLQPACGLRKHLLSFHLCRGYDFFPETHILSLLNLLLQNTSHQWLTRRFLFSFLTISAGRLLPPSTMQTQLWTPLNMLGQCFSSHLSSFSQFTCSSVPNCRHTNTDVVKSCKILLNKLE